MKTFLEQYKNLFLGFMKKELNGWELSAWLDGTEDQQKDFLNENIKAVEEYLKRMDSEKGTNDWKIDSLDFFLTSNNKEPVIKLFKTLGLEERFFVWVDIWEIVSQIREYVSKKKEVIEETKTETEKVKKPFNEIETKEKVIPYQDTFLWIDIGERDKAEALKSVNRESLNAILRKWNLGTIVAEFKKELGADLSKVSFGQFLFITDSDTGKVANIMEKHWYKSDGVIFDYKEASALVWIIRGYYETQKNLPSLSAENKVRMLFDFDKNGKLTTDRNFYVGELQMDFHTFESLTSDKAEALIKNLWLWSLASFTEQMTNNLFAAREQFQRTLWVAIKRWVKPAELVRTGWVEKAINRIYENREAVVADIWERVDEYVRTKLKWFEWVDTNAIKLEAVWLLVGPNSLWAWASFDIEKLDLFFDSLQVWLINWVPWVAVSKRLLEKNGFTVTWTQMYLVIPALTWTYTSKTKIDDFTRMYPKTIKGKTWFSAYASVSPLWWTIGVASQRIDEQTSRWIEQMTDKMWELLKKVSAEIKAWKSFEQSSFYKESKNKDADALIYAEMKQSFDTYARWRKYQDLFLKDMMNGYLGYYENKLYSNADGLKFTSVGIWIAFLSWFTPIPYLTFWGEHISTDWKKVIHSIERERSISYKTLDMNKLGVKETTYKWKKVLMIPNAADYNISNSLWDTQAEVSKGNLYISWDLSSLTIHEHTTNEAVYRTIVIGWGDKDEHGLYLPTRTSKITKSMEWWSIPSKEIATHDIEAITSTASIRENIFNIMQVDALNHKETLWMQKLQRMIFAYKTEGKYSLTQVWNQFNKVVKHKWFKEYAQEKGNASEVDKLLASLKSIKTDSEKVLIVQAVSSNLMKKGALEMKKGALQNYKIEVDKWNKTIREYDREKKRDKYFDTQFSKEFPNLLPAIQKAREAWYEANGNANDYTFKPVSDGSIAFTWVESRNEKWGVNIKWIMPYTWAYNVASVEWGKDFIDIPWKSPEVINALPNKVLKDIQKALNLKSVKAVKDFINAWWGNGITIDYNLAFCKMWECLNDSVVLKDFTITKDWKEFQIWTATTSEVYSPTHNVVNLWIAFTWDVDKNDDKETGQTSTPGEEEVENWGGWTGGWNDGWR